INDVANPGQTITANTGGNYTYKVVYTYNLFGEVASKSEATGDQITYAYDASGRMTSESRTAFTDVNGASVTPTINYSYDSLGDLLSRTDVGAGGTIAAAARTTTY